MAETHVHPPKQTRSRRTLERIVAASLDLLDEEGPEGLTVQAIVQRARSSVGSFYARFDGKDDLLDYLGERVWSEARERWDARLASRDWSAEELAPLVQGAVALLAETARTRSSSLRALDQAGGGSAAFAAFRGHVLDDLGGILLSRRDQMGHPNPELAVRLGLTAVVHVLDDASSNALSGIGPHRLRDEAARLLRSYLQPGEVGEDGAEGVDFFEIWG